MMLFLKVYSLLNINGIFILEYQPWSSYHKKCHYSKTMEENYSKLKIRPEHFPLILQRFGMQLVSKRKPSQVDELKRLVVKGFNREVAVFRKIGGEFEFNIQDVTVENIRSFICFEDFIPNGQIGQGEPLEQEEDELSE